MKAEERAHEWARGVEEREGGRWETLTCQQEGGYGGERRKKVEAEHGQDVGEELTTTTTTKNTYFCLKMP